MVIIKGLHVRSFDHGSCWFGGVYMLLLQGFLSLFGTAETGSGPLGTTADRLETLNSGTNQAARRPFISSKYGPDGLHHRFREAAKGSHHNNGFGSYIGSKC